MDFLSYKPSFDSLMWVKPEPNEHEKLLFARAEKYIQKISWIPWLRMIAVVNSLSMCATHEDSDIDLFVITAKDCIWFVRVFMTISFWLMGVWRKGEDIAGNFCLSFFIEEDAMDMSAIALEDDIYLYFWIYYMRPILVVGDTWDHFLASNTWVIREKTVSLISLPLGVTVWDIFGIFFNGLIRPLWEWKAQRSYEKKWRPTGVIIRKNMLKFHDQDRREFIRDTILWK